MQHPPFSAATKSRTPPMRPDQRIIEGIVTTVAPDEHINVAPMGPIVDSHFHTLILRPFTTSTTYQNLKSIGEGVFHIIDDVELIARGAIGKIAPVPPHRPATHVQGKILTHACRAYEFKVRTLDDSQERTHIEADVVAMHDQRPMSGFNRAKFAVLEAAILATRLHLTGKQTVLARLDELRTLVDKTGAEPEHRAFDMIQAYVADWQETEK